ncbi:HAD family hydrolase [Streptomyces sp. NPDC026672]|uniref:HAD family hydrolase n=1 Tax=unclassified Streptomyces TaxID=2593676 RepID=UPI0033BFCE49
MVRRPLGNHHDGPDTLLVTSDTTQTEAVTEDTEREIEELRARMRSARVVLWDFDGPICRLFAGYSATKVAGELVDWLAVRGMRNLLTAEERVDPDPHVVLRAVDRRHPRSDLVTAIEEHLTAEELRAVPSAMPTAWVDPVIRTWSAVGARLAIVTNNSPVTVRQYLTGRGLHDCFAPHVYGRTTDLDRLKPDPHSLNRALSATGADPAASLMIGDSPSDVAAARKAGVPFLGYARNAQKEELLRDAGAEVVVDSFAPVLRELRRRDFTPGS